MASTDLDSPGTPAPVPTSIIFVDGTNLDRRIIDAFARDDVDYGRLFAKLSTGTRLLHVHYYTAPYKMHLGMEMYKRQTGMLNRLRQLPALTIRLGRHQRQEQKCPRCHASFETQIEKGTDVGAACELVRAACLKLADRLILVSGDTDFVPALKIGREQDVHCEVAFVVGPDEPLGRVLLGVADMRHAARRYTMLDQAFMQDCWYRP